MWWKHSQPSEIKPIPWLSSKATEYLESLLQKDWRVLEYGAGGSTLWFAERVAHVDAMENDLDWLVVLKTKMPNNVIINGAIEPPYNLFLIDGEPVEGRAFWLDIAGSLVAPGGWVVLDNANRPEYSEQRKIWIEKAIKFHSVNGNGEKTKYMVTEFYQCE